MSHIPYRTGLTTIRNFLNRICVLAGKFRSLWSTFMTTEQLEKFDELVMLCHEIVAIIDEIKAS